MIATEKKDKKTPEALDMKRGESKARVGGEGEKTETVLKIQSKNKRKNALESKCGEVKTQRETQP